MQSRKVSASLTQKYHALRHINPLLSNAISLSLRRETMRMYSAAPVEENSKETSPKRRHRNKKISDSQQTSSEHSNTAESQQFEEEPIVEWRPYRPSEDAQQNYSNVEVRVDNSHVNSAGRKRNWNGRATGERRPSQHQGNVSGGQQQTQGDASNATNWDRRKRNKTSDATNTTTLHSLSPHTPESAAARIAQLTTLLHEQAFGYPRLTLHILLTLYDEYISITPELATLALKSFQHSTWQRMTDYFFWHWFDHGMETNEDKKFFAPWFGELKDTYKARLNQRKKGAEVATSPIEEHLISDLKFLRAMFRVIQSPQSILPRGRKFAPTEQDYVITLTALADSGAAKEFMEVRDSMRKRLKQGRQSDSPAVILAMMRLNLFTDNLRGVGDLFTQNLDSSLSRNPDKPKASPNHYSLLISSLVELGDIQDAQKVFACMRNDLPNDVTLSRKAATTLIRKFILNQKQEDAWKLYEEHLETFGVTLTTEGNDAALTSSGTTKLVPDSKILTLMFTMYPRHNGPVERLQPLLDITDRALSLDKDYRDGGSADSQVHEKHAAHVRHLAANSQLHSTFDDEEVETGITGAHDSDINSESSLFHLDYLLTVAYMRACAEVGEPHRALKHFVEFYNTSLREQRDPTLLFPPLRIYILLIDMFSNDIETLERIFVAAIEEFTPDLIARLSGASVFGTLMLLTARMNRFDEMMQMGSIRYGKSAKISAAKLTVPVFQEIGSLLLKSDRVDLLDTFVRTMTSGPFYYDSELHDIFRGLIQQASKQTAHVPEVYNMFSQIHVYPNRPNSRFSKDSKKTATVKNVALPALLDFFLKEQVDKRFASIIRLYLQLPFNVQHIADVAAYYLRAVSNIYSYDHCYNEFLRIYDTSGADFPPHRDTDRTRAMSIAHPLQSKFNSIPLGIEKPVPDRNVFKMLMNEAIARGMIAAVEEMLPLMEKYCPQAAHTLEEYRILGQLKHSRDIAAAIKHTVEYYNTAISTNPVLDVKPQFALYKELLYSCRPHQAVIALELLSLVEKDYPEMVKSGSFKKMKKRVGVVAKFASKFRPPRSNEDSEGAVGEDGASGSSRFKSTAQERSNPDHIVTKVNKLLDEGKFSSALGLIPKSHSAISSGELDNRSFQKIVFRFARTGSMLHLKELLTIGETIGVSAYHCADAIVTGLVEGGHVREALAFFQKLYETPLNDERPSELQKRPSKKMYVLMLSTLKQFNINTGGQMREHLENLRRSFHIQYPLKQQPNQRVPRW